MIDSVLGGGVGGGGGRLGAMGEAGAGKTISFLTVFGPCSDCCSERECVGKSHTPARRTKGPAPSSPSHKCQPRKKTSLFAYCTFLFK